MSKTNIRLSDHFTYKKLLRFTIPSIVMMIFTSIYGVVDGFFVSNFVGKTSFAAVNLIMPFLMILGTIGFMFGTGGSALVSKTLGEGDTSRANRIFSMIVYISVALGIILSILGIIFIRPVATFLGARGKLLEDCITYGRVILIALPAFILQMEFQSFFITAEKPQLGLFVTVLSGVTNMVLDALLVGIFSLGLPGAALATGISQIVGGTIPLIYFFGKNSSLLKLTRTSFDGKALLKTCTNGSSEMMTNISLSFISMIFNFQLMKYAGENGIAAYGVLMYVNFVFVSVFIGYSVGIAPVIGYHYGAENKSELHGLLQKSNVVIAFFAIIMFFAAKLLSQPFSIMFVGYDTELVALTCRAFSIYAYSFLFAGFAIFTSSFFTALNNGLVSALISFLRILLFQSISVLTLPLIFGIDGIWASVTVAEILAVILSVFFLVTQRKKYGY